MKAYVLLAVILMSTEALAGGKFGHGRKRKGKGKGKRDDLGDLDKKLDQLQRGDDDAKDIFNEFKQLHSSFADDLFEISKNQFSIEGLHNTSVDLVRTVNGNTKKILLHQKEILNGQGKIKTLVTSTHEKTREEFHEGQKKIQEGLETAGKRQGVILDKIEKGRDRAESAIDDILHAQADTHKELGKLQHTVADNAAANLQGQARIVQAVRNTEEAVQKDIDKIVGKQKVILKSLDESQQSVEGRLDTVSSRQQDILDAISNSQSALQSDLNQVKKQQESTQTKVRQSQAAVQEDIKEVEKNEEVTQHLLKKCDSSCDLSKALSSINAIKKKIAEVTASVQKDIHGVLSSESVTQSKVDSLAKAVLKQLDFRTDKTLHKMRESEKYLDDIITQAEDDVKDLIKDTQMLENTQETIEHSLDKILEDLGGLSFLKGGVGVKKFR